GLFNVIPVLAHDRLGLNADRIGLGLALASLVGLGGIYPSGVLVDRYGRKSVIVPATFMAGISLVLFLLAPSYAWFLAGCVAWSVAAGVGGAAPAAYAADVAPPGMNAAAMSGFRMLADLGYVVGPIALGLATDLVGADATLGGAALLLAGTALLFARFAPAPHRRALACPPRATRQRCPPLKPPHRKGVRSLDQALRFLFLFLYREVLGAELPWLDGV